MQCAAKRATRLKIFSIPSLSLITSPRPPAQKGKSSRTKEIPIRCILPEATFSPKARGACFGPLSTGFKCNLVGIGKGKVISHTKGWNSWRMWQSRSFLWNKEVRQGGQHLPQGRRESRRWPSALLGEQQLHGDRRLVPNPAVGTLTVQPRCTAGTLGITCHHLNSNPRYISTQRRNL